MGIKLGNYNLRYWHKIFIRSYAEYAVATGFRVVTGGGTSVLHKQLVKWGVRIGTQNSRGSWLHNLTKRTKTLLATHSKPTFKFKSVTTREHKRCTLILNRGRQRATLALFLHGSIFLEENGFHLTSSMKILFLVISFIKISIFFSEVKEHRPINLRGFQTLCDTRFFNTFFCYVWQLFPNVHTNPYIHYAKPYNVVMWYAP